MKKINNKNKVVEICCGSYEDAVAAYKGGAKRIELNSSLFLGGLTPSLGSLLLTKANTELQVICMIRPRGAGFCYSPLDFQVMKQDGEIMMKNGAQGLAFGCLTKNNSEIKIEENQTRELINIAHKYGGEAVFHRAFDCVSDPIKAIEKLIELGADRILTSGQKQKAWDGRLLIKELQTNYGDKIQILPGSGINSTNSKLIMDETGVFQVHSSCKDWINDNTTENGELTFAYSSGNNKNKYEIVSLELVKKIICSI